MPKGLIIAIAAAATLVCGAQSGPTIRINADKAPANSGKQMYNSYCASCHGLDGRGNGPVAAELKTRPTDLTRLAEKNQGKYPSVHVFEALQRGGSVPAHGTADMPVWGPIFDTMDANSRLRVLRISNLTEYLKSIQAK